MFKSIESVDRVSEAQIQVSENLKIQKITFIGLTG